MRTSLALLAAFCLLLTSPARAFEPSVLDETVYRLQMGNAKDAMFMVTRLGNVNATDRSGWPLLAIAASRTDQEALAIVKSLVEAGAKINYGGGGSFFPIIYSVQNGNVEVTRYLLDQGADYRVTDALGFRLVDFARQSGNKELSRMIEEAVDRDVKALTNSRSKANLDKLAYDLTYHSCAEQYLTYYYASKQDPIPEATQKEMLSPHSQMAKDSMGKLATIFKIPTKKILEIRHASQQSIFGEMEKMVSNRWRRQQGIGKEGDMEARCDKVSKSWNTGSLDQYSRSK